MAAGTLFREALGSGNAIHRSRSTFIPSGVYVSIVSTSSATTNRQFGGERFAARDATLELMPSAAYEAFRAIWAQLMFDPAASGSLYNQAATFTATGTLAVSRQMIFGVVRPFSATGSLTVGKWIAKGVSFTATGTLALQRLISVSKSFTATGSLAVQAAKAFFVTASMAATGTLVAAKQLSMAVSRAFSAVGTLATSQTFIPGAVGPAVLAEYVRRFFTYLGRRW